MARFREATNDDLQAVLRLYPGYRLYVGELGDEVVATFALLIMDNLAHRGKPTTVTSRVLQASVVKRSNKDVSQRTVSTHRWVSGGMGTGLRSRGGVLP